MDNGGRELIIRQKRKREEEEMHEEEEEEKEVEIMVLVVCFLIAAIGAWYHHKYMAKEPTKLVVDERLNWRTLWMGNLQCQSTCIQ